MEREGGEIKDRERGRERRRGREGEREGEGGREREKEREGGKNSARERVHECCKKTREKSDRDCLYLSVYDRCQLEKERHMIYIKRREQSSSKKITRVRGSSE